jgi:hypothetical protein
MSGVRCIILSLCRCNPGKCLTKNTFTAGWDLNQHSMSECKNLATSIPVFIKQKITSWRATTDDTMTNLIENCTNSSTTCICLPHYGGKSGVTGRTSHDMLYQKKVTKWCRTVGALASRGKLLHHPTLSRHTKINSPTHSYNLCVAHLPANRKHIYPYMKQPLCRLVVCR